jgi:hypothetical protein
VNRAVDLVTPNPRYRYAQVAVAGRWEAALRLDPRSPDLLESIGANHEFALELIFGDRATPQSCFIGVRFETSDPARRRHLVTAIRSLDHDTTVRAAANTLADELDMPLFGCPISFVELGVFDMWQSIDAARIWTHNRAAWQRDQLRQLIGDRPHLLEMQPNPIMVEFATNTLIPHWVGIDVSRRHPTGHIVDLDRLGDLCDAALAPIPPS